MDIIMICYFMISLFLIFSCILYQQEMAVFEIILICGIYHSFISSKIE